MFRVGHHCVVAGGAYGSIRSFGPIGADLKGFHLAGPTEGSTFTPKAVLDTLGADVSCTRGAGYEGDTCAGVGGVSPLNGAATGARPRHLLSVIPEEPQRAIGGVWVPRFEDRVEEVRRSPIVSAPYNFLHGALHVPEAGDAVGIDVRVPVPTIVVADKASARSREHIRVTAAVTMSGSRRAAINKPEERTDLYFLDSDGWDLPAEMLSPCAVIHTPHAFLE